MRCTRPGDVRPVHLPGSRDRVCYSIAQLFGATGPLIHGTLIGDGSDSTRLFYGYLLGAGVMVVGGVVSAVLDVAAAGKSLEEIATPLAARRPPSPGRRAPRAPERPDTPGVATGGHTHLRYWQATPTSTSGAIG